VRSLLVLCLLVGCGRGNVKTDGEGGGGGGDDDEGGGDVAENGERPETAPPPAEGHPRLWIRAQDLPTLRKWATNENPIWEKIEGLAKNARDEMDGGKIGGDACADSSGVEFCELYAEFFAFLSLVDPDEKDRIDYAVRARTLLMKVLNVAAKGKKEEHPIRETAFPVDNRSRWTGEGFPLTVDWIYPYLTAADKKLIRKVFLRWNKERLDAAVTSHNHPEPKGVLNDPKLVADRAKVRFAGNNYFTSHMRLNGLAAMALDPEDDPGGELGAYLENAVGAWMYMVDHLMRNDAAGGLMPEGFEYSPQTTGYAAQFILGVYTAGRSGKLDLATFEANPWWDDLIATYHHTMSPVTVEHEWMGPVHQPAWYGDGQRFWADDAIDMLAPMGIYFRMKGDQKRYDAIRWIERKYPPGGWDGLAERVDDVTPPGSFRKALLYFLLFDPRAADPKDPRPQVALQRWVPGVGHLYARTSWGKDASWFTWICGWVAIDHQHADGNQIELYRNGEWLTKERTGYGDNIAASDYHNTIVLENKQPYHHEKNDARYKAWKRGSQWWNGVSDGQCKVIGQEANEGFAYGAGDTTLLYNSKYEEVGEVTHASRGVVWLRPDHIVVYDRGGTKKKDAFKRFWLNLPAQASVSGTRATMTTPKGQKLHVTTLLPEGARISSEVAEKLEDEREPADMEPMKHRLRVEPGDARKDVRFLHVLQGADGKAKPDAPVLVTSSNGLMTGAAVRGVVVMFPTDPPVGNVSATFSYDAPGGATAHVITGLVPGGKYDVVQSGGKVTVKSGGAKKASKAGVLAWGLPGTK
jgi:hypothetical protein